MLRKLLFSAALGPVLAACATFLSAAHEVTPQQTAAIRATCTRVVRLRPGAEFEACVSSLSVASQDAATLPAGAAAKLNANNITPADSNPDDYFESSFKMRLRREQYACGELGLEPGTAAFASCADNLDREIFTVDHPNG